MSNLGLRLRSRLSPAIVISVIAVVLAMSGWTLAATGGGDGNTIRACVVKQGPDKGLLRVIARGSCSKGTRSLVFNREGPAGPRGATGPTGAAGAKGATGPAGTPAPLPALEAVHFVGAPGQPAFELGSKNSDASSRAGFYKDQLGIVHLQGTVDAGDGDDIFRLPVGFRSSSSDQICFSVPGFKAGATVFVTNRLCIIGGDEVRNERGEGVVFINLDGITFRAAG